MESSGSSPMIDEKGKRPEIGILMLDTSFPRFRGDIGHPDTFPFPVERKTIRGASSQKVVIEGSESVVEPFIEAAKEMERSGIKAIATSCGFMARHQSKIANALRIPFASSALAWGRMIEPLLSDHRKLGILTARRESLDAAILSECDLEDERVVIEGMEGTQFYSMYVKNDPQADTSVMPDELLLAGEKLLARDPAIGAIILECTNMPPFSDKLRAKTKLPIFDVIALVELMQRAL